MNMDMINRNIVLTRFLRIPLLAGLVMVLMGTAAIAEGPDTVNLRTAEDFILLAKTGISITGVSDITGDIGVSPADATYITGFGLIMDPSGTFSTSSLITGKVYAADYTDPTPTKMTTAIGDMETAYTDASGRTVPDYSELYTGDLTGQTLTPGLYKWGTGVMVSAGGVTISGAADDIWIFQVAGDLTFGDGANVTLLGGAQVSNIFWQVAGQVSLGTTAAMKGIILCQTQIVMNTGATLNGRAMAQSAVTMDANTLTHSTPGTGVAEDFVPQEFSLSPNYPNPFNPSTTLLFTLPESGQVLMTVYDLQGREITRLLEGNMDSGAHSVQWNGRNEAGNQVSSGIYLVRLVAGTRQITQKVVLAR